MALEVGTNSYLDVTEADAYFADRLFSSTWETAEVTDKPKALIQATKAIEELTFSGTRYLDTQALSFPRSGLVVDGILLDETVVPQAVKEAVCEYAILMLSEDYTAPDDLEAFDSVSLGSISIDVNSRKSGKSLPPKVEALLSRYQDNTLTLSRG